MRVIPTAIREVLILEPNIHGDDRGFFFESYNRETVAECTGITQSFVQDNHSKSARNVLRGLHYQIKRPQGKLVRVIVGELFDVVVDIRRSSPTLGHWVGAKLSAQSKRQLWIPVGCAHGFLVLSESTECLYKATDYWSPADERSIIWNDSDLAIDWPIATVQILSEKDRKGIRLKNAGIFP